MSHKAVCNNCGEPLIVVIDLDQTEVLNRLDRIEQALTIEGDLVSELDDRLAQLTTAFADFATTVQTELDDVTRLLTDWQNAHAGALTPEEAASFDAAMAGLAGLKDKVAAATAAIDTTDPAPAAPAEPTV